MFQLVVYKLLVANSSLVTFLSFFARKPLVSGKVFMFNIFRVVKVMNESISGRVWRVICHIHETSIFV